MKAPYRRRARDLDLSALEHQAAGPGLRPLMFSFGQISRSEAEFGTIIACHDTVDVPNAARITGLLDVVDPLPRDLVEVGAVVHSPLRSLRPGGK